MEKSDISEHKRKIILPTRRSNYLFIYLYKAGNVVFPSIRKATYHFLLIQDMPVIKTLQSIT